MLKTVGKYDPSAVATELDEVTAAPKIHKVLFEKEGFRVISLLPAAEDSVPHRLPSVVFLIE